MFVNKGPVFSMIYLSDEEIKNKSKELIKIANEMYPDLENISSSEYIELKEAYLKGDKTAQERLEMYSLKLAIHELVYIYTHRECLDYDFCDAINDSYLKVVKSLKANVNAENLSVFNIFVSKNIMNEYVKKFTSRAIKNLDIANANKEQDRVSFMDLLDEEDISTTIHEKFEQEEIKKTLKKTYGFLKAKELKIVKMFYGIDEKFRLSLNQIGEKYGVTGSNVGFQYVKGMKKLTHPMMKLLIEEDAFSTIDKDELDTVQLMLLQ